MALAALRRFFTQDTDLPQGWLDEYKEDFKYTPDIRTLEMGRRWFVFEYGECMEGKRDHKTLMDSGRAVRVGHAFTKFSNLIMYKKQLGEYAYPVVLGRMPRYPKMQYRIQENTLPGRIKGDLFLMEGVDQIVLLDMARENGVAFRRIRMEILFPYFDGKQEQLTSCPAWIYIGLKDYWDNLIDGGYSATPVRRFKHVNRGGDYVMGDYYFYSKLEDE